MTATRRRRVDARRRNHARPYADLRRAHDRAELAGALGFLLALLVLVVLVPLLIGGPS